MGEKHFCNFTAKPQMIADIVGGSLSQKPKSQVARRACRAPIIHKCYHICTAIKDPSPDYST